MHTPNLTLLDPPLAISYKNHQKSVAYFSHLAPLISFCFTKRQSQEERIGRGGGVEIAQRPLLNTLLTALNRFRDMIIMKKESTIAFSDIDKLVALF